MCNFTSGFPNELSDHIEMMHTRKSASSKNDVSGLKCDNCSYIAEDNATIMTHMRTIHENTNEQCQYCDFAAHDDDTLKAHMVEILQEETPIKKVYTFSSLVLCS